MRKKRLLLALLAVVLLGAALYLSKDWFASSDIQIGSTIRPNRLSERQQNRLGPALKHQPYTVSFFFNRKYQLESLKVVKAQEIDTNRFAHPLWELISNSNSIPVKTLTYGVPIRGMRPEVKGAQADVLQQGVPYRLLLKIGGREVSHDFTVGKR